MTENLDTEAKAKLERIQKKDPAQATDLVRQELLSSPAYQSRKLKVDQAIKAGILPKEMTEGKAIVIAQWAHELDVDPMVALNNFFVVNGKIGISAAFMKARVHEKIPKCLFKITENSATECVAVTKRDKDDPNEPIATWRYTIKEAQDAGITGKDVWKKYPADMLRARCITRAVRGEFSDVFLGRAHDPEELEDPFEDQKENELREISQRYIERGRNVQVPTMVNEDSYGRAEEEAHDH